MRENKLKKGSLALGLKRETFQPAVSFIVLSQTLGSRSQDLSKPPT